MTPRKKAVKAASYNSDSDEDDQNDARGGKGEQLDLNLPPLNKLDEIFAHMISTQSDKLATLFKDLGRPLRVATMCSGTESPILALRLMFRALEAQRGVHAEVDHVFSAEIEPFKQAYIERNFAPPLLFRDVTELPNDEARTAYGSFAKVPGNVDMLIAGTSCVDFSNLNGKQKTLTDNGESGRTFFAMLEWVKKHRPKVVIQENVSGAPWVKIEGNFADIGYAARHIRLDTKKYYIPHTRTRGYLVAFPDDNAKENFFGKKNKDVLSPTDMAEKWVQKVKGAERLASVPTEAFLLSSDDPRVHRARQELAHQKVNADGKKRDAVDWGRCEVRHSIQRQKEKLGAKRPLTDWQDGGAKPKLPDGAWQDWAEAQTERVTDLMDISFLRQAKLGVDISYKSAIWNLSQNVDRTTASKVFGVTPCLTPNMIPYLTNRGGPVVGIEALALQGLPVEELLLTRESTDQLADLAGNAMSSTVVGTAILCALTIAGHTLDRDAKKKEDEDENGDAVMTEDSNKKPAAPTDEDLEARFRGEDRLVEHPVDLASHKAAPTDLLDRAHRSARKCTCEGRQGVAEHPISTCVGCGHSSCKLHQGKPEHHYVDAELKREDPSKFEADLRELLPMRLTVPGFDRESVTKVVEQAREKGSPINKKIIDRYVDVVVDALDKAEFHFHHVDRREFWTASYGADQARLELFFGQAGMEWRMYALPPAELAALDPLRVAFEQPIAHLKIAAGSMDLLDGSWSFSLPLSSSSTSIQLSFEFDEDDSKNDSWRKRLGLVDFQQEKSPSRIKVKYEGDDSLLERPINGTYRREDKCGTAMCALYRRVEPEEERPLYFFFDPSAYLENVHDRFVFAETCSRVTTARPLVASLQPQWRLNPFKVKNERSDNETAEPYDPDMNPSIAVSSAWVTLEASRIVAGGADVNDASSFATIKTDLRLSVAEHQCEQAELLLTAHVPLAKSPSSVWANEHWHDVDLQHEGPEVFSKLGWMLSRIPDWQSLRDWQAVEDGTAPEEVCQRCAPVSPQIQWIRQFKLKTGPKGDSWDVSIAAREDGKQAASYEMSLKNRPAPVVVHTRQLGSDFQFKAGLNAVSLAHRALAQLPAHKTLAPSSPKVEWRLISSANTTLGRDDGRVFTLQSNRDNPQAENPSRFREVKLRPEQLRSLHWMIDQEANPKPWLEEEVAEAPIPQLGWTAEAKVSREVVVRGGVVADAVGYGKTAITLGLIASRRAEDKNLPEDEERIAIKATLIVVPKHLSEQWPDEVAKFTQPKLKTLVIQNHAHLKKFTIADFQEADIVIVSESLFTSDVYWPYTADFCASPRDVKTDKKAGRYFRYCVDVAMESLGAQIKRIVEEGTKEAHKAIKRARESRNEDYDHEDIINESRKKANAKAASQGKKVKAPPPKPKSFKRSAEVANDEWGFLSSKARNDWTELQGPPLAAFSWARVVLDEFSYTEGAALVGIHTCRGRARWILSGTPPLRDFSEIKSIASLLNVHLGIDDENEGVAEQVSNRNKEATKAEQFRSYCDVRTKAWHARRDDIAQRFLDQFARQNRAEIEDIPLDIEHVGVRLPGAEMAIYRELEHHLYSIDPNLAKLAKIKVDKQSDRDRRLREALGQSKSPEEALLKRCSHFTLDLDEGRLAGEEAPDVCDFIHDLREEQLKDCKQQIKRQILAASYMHRDAVSKGYYNAANATPRHFAEWVKAIHSTATKDNAAPDRSQGDAGADAFLRELAIECGCTSEEHIGRPRNSKDKHRSADVALYEEKRNKSETEDTYRVGRTTIVRDAVVILNRLVKELIGRIRSARYFDTVRRVLRSADSDADSNIAVLSCCGHHGKIVAVQEEARWGRCVDPTCGAQVQHLNILTAESLGSDRNSGHYGYKLETLVTLIEKTPKEDRVLVFVQFDDLFAKVYETLVRYGVPTEILQGTATAQAKTLTAFQKKKVSGAKVLLLKATDSSSSGANLTMANWAFFVSPLLTDSKAKYTALATQAIGRIHRYGQLKRAKVVHLLTHATLDMPTFEQMNDISHEKLIASVEKRGEIVPPLRERTGKWEPKISKGGAKKAAAKKASPKKKQDSTPPPSDDDDDASEPESDDGSSNRRAPVKKAPPKKAAGRGKRAASIVISDDDAEESEASMSDESEEEEVDLTDDDSSEDERPKKKKASNKKKSAEDNYSDSDIEVASGPTTPIRKLQPRRSAVAAKAIVEDSEEDEDDDEDMIIAQPPPKKAVTGSKGKAKAAPAKATKKRTIVASSDEEEEEEKSAPTASDKTKPKVTASASKSKPTSSSSGSARPSPIKKARSSFIGVEVPSPKAKKQSQLYAFFKKDLQSKDAKPAREAKRKADVLEGDAAVAEASGSGSGSAAKASKKPRLEEPVAAASPSLDANADAADEVVMADVASPVQNSEPKQDDAAVAEPEAVVEEVEAVAAEVPAAGEAAPEGAPATPASEAEQEVGGLEPSSPAPEATDAPASPQAESEVGVLDDDDDDDDDEDDDVAAGHDDAQAEPAVEEPASKSGPPSVGESEGSATSSTGGVSTALTTPAVEHDKQLGVDLADSTAMEVEEAAA